MADAVPLTLSLPADALDKLADLVAERVVVRLGARRPLDDGWMTTAEAAEYLGLPSVNALHRLTSAHKVPFAQDRPGGKCWFRRSDLDQWRELNASTVLPRAQNTR